MTIYSGGVSKKKDQNLSAGGLSCFRPTSRDRVDVNTFVHSLKWGEFGSSLTDDESSL